MDKCSKLSLCNDGEDGRQQKEDHLVANDEANKISTCMMAVLKDLAKMEWCPPKE